MKKLLSDIASAIKNDFGDSLAGDDSKRDACQLLCNVMDKRSKGKAWGKAGFVRSCGRTLYKGASGQAYVA